MEATVEAVADRVVLARAAAGCGGCAARCWGRTDRQVRVPLGDLAADLAPGDRIRFTVDRPYLLQVVLLAYGLPFAGLVTGAALAGLLGGADGAVLTGGLLGVAISGYVQRCCRRPAERMLRTVTGISRVDHPPC